MSSSSLPPDASPALARFREAFFGEIDQYLAWHDGYEADTAALDALTPAERALAEQELIAGLLAPRGADARAVIGLGHLGSRAALPVLHQLLPAIGSYVLPAIARIDAQATDWPQLDALLHAKLSEYTLVDLLVGLRSGYTLTQLPPAIPASVLALLTHKDYLVRYHALATLRQLYCLPMSDASQPKDDHIFSLICSDKKARQYREAQQLIREQIRARGYAM